MMNNLQLDELKFWVAVVIAIAFVFFLGAIAVHCQAQTISFSPTSVPLWGQAPHTAKLSVEYKDFEVLAMASTKETLQFTYKEENIGQYGGAFLGVFWKPLHFDFKGFNFKGGVGVLNRGFPNELGEQVHFTAQLSYRLTNHIGVGYSHYSNGMGLWNPINPGADWLAIQYHF